MAVADKLSIINDALIATGNGPVTVHAVMTDVCQQLHVNTLDFRRQFPSWNYMSGNAYNYDSIHPNNAGYAVLANALAAVL